MWLFQYQEDAHANFDLVLIVGTHLKVCFLHMWTYEMIHFLVIVNPWNSLKMPLCSLHLLQSSALLPIRLDALETRIWDMRLPPPLIPNCTSEE